MHFSKLFLPFALLHLQTEATTEVIGRVLPRFPSLGVSVLIILSREFLASVSFQNLIPGGGGTSNKKRPKPSYGPPQGGRKPSYRAPQGGRKPSSNGGKKPRKPSYKPGGGGGGRRPSYKPQGVRGGGGGGGRNPSYRPQSNSIGSGSLQPPPSSYQGGSRPGAGGGAGGVGGGGGGTSVTDYD